MQLEPVLRHVCHLRGVPVTVFEMCRKVWKNIYFICQLFDHDLEYERSIRSSNFSENHVSTFENRIYLWGGVSKLYSYLI